MRARACVCVILAFLSVQFVTGEARGVCTPFITTVTPTFKSTVQLYYCNMEVPKGEQKDHGHMSTISAWSPGFLLFYLHIVMYVSTPLKIFIVFKTSGHFTIIYHHSIDFTLAISRAVSYISYLHYSAHAHTQKVQSCSIYNTLMKFDTDLIDVYSACQHNNSKIRQKKIIEKGSISQAISWKLGHWLSNL